MEKKNKTYEVNQNTFSTRFKGLDRVRLFAWLLLRLKQPQQILCLVTSKTQFNFSEPYDNSRFECEFCATAPSCFLKLRVYMHSAIHL